MAGMCAEFVFSVLKSRLTQWFSGRTEKDHEMTAPGGKPDTVGDICGQLKVLYRTIASGGGRL